MAETYTDYRSQYTNDRSISYNPSNQPEYVEEANTENNNKFFGDKDLVTEREMVPDILERILIRYDKIYNGDNNFRISGFSRHRFVKLLYLLMSFIPSAIRKDSNNIDVIERTNTSITEIIAGSTSVSFTLDAGSVINRAYLSSNMIDMKESLTKTSNSVVDTYTYNPTIQFRDKDELIVIFTK